MKPAGLYIHIPFCMAKCHYCDFFSVRPAPGRITPLVTALVRELAASPIEREGLPVRSIFVGGGTPTALPSGELGRLFRVLNRLNRRDHPAEFTVEANPATLDETRISILRDSGVNRISLGAQSFNLVELDTLGRIHGPEDILRTVDLVRRSGIGRLNLDLIFGIPGQTRASWGRSLAEAIGTGVEHISCYALTYEPGTLLYERRTRGLIQPPDEELEAAMYEQAIDTLTAAGFDQYEISNFARPGAACLHNLGYWTGEPYIGIGPSAAGYINGHRLRNVADVDEYVRLVMAGESPVIERERLDPRRQAGEAAMLELRLCAGIDRERFRERFGHDPVTLFGDAIGVHTANGRITVTPTHVRLTRVGQLVADAVIADFL